VLAGCTRDPATPVVSAASDSAVPIPSTAGTPSATSALATAPASEVLQQAAAHAEAAGSARVSFSTTVSGSGSMTGTGVYTFTTPTQGAIEFTTVVFGGQLMPGGMTILMTPDAYYLGSPAFEEETGKAWARISLADVAEESGLELGQLVQNDNPALYLQLLLNAPDLSRVGQETVADVPTTHYRGTVDYAAALDALTPELRAQAEQKLAQSGLEAAVVDVWIDEQGQLRQFAQEAASPAGTVEVRMVFEEYGVPVDVAPPADADTVDIRELTG
jgi:hypothetical protein